MKSPHYPVMNSEIITVFSDTDQSLFIDCTVGLGGHSYYMLTHFIKSRVIAIDIDGSSIRRAKQHLAAFSDRIRFYRCNYLNLFENIDLSGSTVSGILVDPGLSMEQLKNTDRGFSHQVDSRLDMRKDTSLELTAAEVVNRYSEAELAAIFREYGEVRNPEKLAKKIIERRLFSPIETTRQLRETVEHLDKNRLKKGRPHPAAKVFQALRIFVNKELEGVDQFLQKLPDFLNRGSRIVYLTYHSIEDRIVKRGLRLLRETGRVRILKPFPMFPSQEEILENRASRSAKLRAAEVL